MDLREPCPILTGILVSILVFALPFLHDIRWSPRTTCIHVPPPSPPTTTLGELYQRSQLAFFLSHHLSADLSLASHPAFARCPPPEPSCRLDEEALILPRCDTGDCACHAQKVAPYLKHLSHCRTIQLTVDKFSQLEFSGCTGHPVSRYVAPQNGTYNVLAYAASGVTSMLLSEADYIQKQLCKLSDKPIVVISDAVTKVPICENRTVLAPSLDDETIVSLIAGAQNVGAIGGANVHMGVAGMKGGRLIMTARPIAEFDWAPVDDFTVIGMKGAIFHFDSAEIMRQEVSGYKDSRMATRQISLREGEEQIIEETYLMRDFPKKTWSRGEQLA